MLPADSPFFLTDMLASYVKQRFLWHISEMVHATPDRIDSIYSPPILIHRGPGPTPPLNLNARLVVDCEHLANVAARAYLTRGDFRYFNKRVSLSHYAILVTVENWDAQRYDHYLPKKPTGRQESEEERIRARYPIEHKLTDVLLSDPTIIIDCYGRILVWYLPGALSWERRVCDGSSWMNLSSCSLS
jgi:hypothetical protein